MTLEEVKEYLKIDYEDEDNYLKDLIDIVEIYIDECVGTEYKKDKNKVKLSKILIKKLISDLYENRSCYIDSRNKRDIIVTTILDKLSL